MQGYVIGIKKVKEEDLLVTVVTENKIKTMYRLYGARHSAINLGYKIDFSAEPIQNRMLLRLRDVTHLGFSWLQDRNKLLAWQGFCKLLYEHLKEVNEHGGFYFELLENAAIKIEKSKPKRVLAESYLALLKHEGRFHEPHECFFCGEEIKESENIALSRAFLPSHEKCIFSQGFESTKIRDFFEAGSTILLNDAEVEALHGVMLLGF
jgi:recombinational DNA repair protein (RecF pathway)